MGVTVAGEDVSQYYKPLLSEIKLRDVCWNSNFETGDMKMESMANIVVDGTNENKHRVYILQYASDTRTL